MTMEATDIQSPAMRPARRGLPLPIVGLVFLTIGFTVLVSAYMLDSHGIPYGVAGGSPLAKIHPMTYCALLTMGLAIIASGDPKRYMRLHIDRFPGTSFFLLILILMVIWTAVIQRQPLTSLIDTFLSAILIVYLISDLTPRQHRLLTTLVHVFMCANALLGILEVGSGWRLTPLMVGGVNLTWDWRASAFLGHPLENAMLSGLYTLMVAFGADTRIRPFARIAIVGLQVAGLVVFGGRTAMILAYAVLLLRLAWLSIGVLRGNRFDPRMAAAIVMALPIVAGALLVAYDAGTFDKVLERFIDDNGSAATRISMLRIFNSFPLSDLLIAPDPSLLAEGIYQEGTDAGIESFEFGFFLQSGVLISIFFFCGLAGLTFDVWRVGGPAALLHIAYFYLVASGAASLSVKGQTLAQFALLFMTVEAMPSLLDRPKSQSPPSGTP